MLAPTMHPAPVPLASVRGFVVVLVAAILGLVFTALGLTFTVLGAVGDGSGDAFASIGPVLLAIGLVNAALAGLYRVARRRAEQERAAARTERATATVVASSLNGGVRVAGRHPLTLTVDLLGRHVTGRALVYPHQTPEPGTPIDVAFAPGDPANFVPV